MPRFYCSPPLPISSSFDLPPDAAHHAARVLRLREGNHVEIFDGDRESPLQVLLAQAMSSSEKMDWVIQKATELGVTEIQPLDTERSIARLSAERATKRLDHWHQVAISACEQCGRNVLPKIHAPLDIMIWLQQVGELSDKKFILLPEGGATLRSQAKPPEKVILLIGAEGGFTQIESEAAQHCGFTGIRMGARVLRTETAAIAGLAALQMLWGDF